jgi:hypothetical protein
VVGEIHRHRRLCGCLHEPALRSPAQARWLAPTRQLAQERLGPEVLVNVYLQRL